jgi:hypothetical protein
VKTNHIIIKSKICENRPYIIWYVFTYFTFYNYMVCFHIFYLLLSYGLFSHILPFIIMWSFFTYFTFYYYMVCFHIFYFLLLYGLFSHILPFIIIWSVFNHIIIKGKICENRPYNNKR